MRAAGTTADAQTKAAGFTLVEVLVAIVILIFGLIAITNLFVIAGSSNVVARSMSASAAQAAEVMELLKGAPFADLAVGGGLNVDNAATGKTWRETEPILLHTSGGAATTVDNYEADRLVSGVGVIRIRWQIVLVDANTRFIRVVAAPASPLVRARGRVELAVFRTCTSGVNGGCPTA